MSELKWPSEEEVRKMFAKKEGFGSDATLSAAMELPEVRAVLALLAEARADLETYVNADYPADTCAEYPDIARRHARDMELCRRIDAALAAIKEPKT